MFIKRRKFFSRKNKKSLYNKYLNDYTAFKTLCERYENKLSNLNAVIKDNVSNQTLYNYLNKVKDDVVGLGRESICYTYQDCFGGLDIIFTANDYCDLMFKTQKMTLALGKMEATLELVDYLKLKKLAIGSN